MAFWNRKRGRTGVVLREAPFGMRSGITRGSGIGELPRLGTRQLIDGYNTFPWLRGVVDKISEIAAGVRWKVQVKMRDGTWRVINDHPMEKLMNQGSPVFSGYALRSLLWKYFLMVGEFFCVIERNAFGMPVNLWPIPAHWVLYAPTFADAANPDLDQQYYRVQFRRWLAHIPPSEMIHIYEPNPSMPYGRGQGRAMTIGDELETDEYAARFMKAFFYNSARPDILITSQNADAPIGEDSARDLERKWTEKIQGAWKAWKPMFLSGGPVTVTPLRYDNSNAEYVNLRKFDRDIILQMYGIPPETLGVLENANRSTIDAAEFFLTKHVVMPKVRFIAEAWEHRLSKEFDPRLVVGYDSVVQVDKEQKLAMMKSQPAAFCIDDIREGADLKPLGGDIGRRHILPVNQQVVDMETGEVFIGAGGGEGEELDDLDSPHGDNGDEQSEDSKKAFLQAVEVAIKKLPAEQRRAILRGINQRLNQRRLAA